MKKEYIVFNQRLAGYLMMNGFVLKKLQKTKRDDSNRNIFIFNESENLINKIKEYQLINKL